MYITSYNKRSASARALSRELALNHIPLDAVKSKAILLNWGVGSSKSQNPVVVCLNAPNIVAMASDKRKFFKLMSSASKPPRIPPWTTEVSVVKRWLEEGKEVVARHLYRSRSGKGIQFSSEGSFELFLEAPLWTQYLKKKDEYRVHIVRGNVIDVQRKAVRADADKEKIDYRIRTHSKGFVFVRNSISPPKDVIDQAMLAFNASGLDFGAVDVIYNEHYDQACVLEINTAPGLEGTTLERYVEALRPLVRP